MSAKHDSRIADIYSYLMTHSYASVTELTEVFQVSRSTIKRDLIEMEQKNLAEKIHGGVVLKPSPDLTYSARKNLNSAAKARIGKAAAELIEDYDIILIMGGVTCFEVYKAIQASNITVFSINLESFTTQNPNVEHLYILEGEVSTRFGVITGPMTIQNLQRINPNKIFFTCSYSPSYQLSCRTDSELALLSAIMKMNAQKIFVADESKLRNRPFIIAPMDELDVFVTDASIPDEQKQKFDRSHVRVIKV